VLWLLDGFVFSASYELEGREGLSESFSGQRQKVTTKDLRSTQPPGESALISSRDWRGACSFVYFVVRSFNREASPNDDDDTHSSRPPSSGDRVFDLELGIAADCPFQAASVRGPSESQQSEAHQEEGQVKEFKGKILKSGGKFVLEESSNGGNYGSYLLDDQATAKKYEGQRVVVTGTLDAPHNTIHVRRIEAVA
jgi:hypothetical protein